MDEGAVTHRDPIETLCRSVAGGLVDWLLWPGRKLMSLLSDIATILANTKTILTQQAAQQAQLNAVEATAQQILDDLQGPPETIEGITVIPGPVTTHPVLRRLTMKTLKLFKKGHALKKMAAPPTSLDIGLVDNGDGSYVVAGVDQAGNGFALDPAKTTIAATSDTPATVVADLNPAPNQTAAPMTFFLHVPANPAPAVGAKAVVTVTATWTDGSGTGPFSFTLNVTIDPSAPAGITVTPGPVVSH